MYNELLLDAVDFSLDFCLLVKGDGGRAMLFNFLIGGVGEVSEDDEVAGLPLKLFLPGVSESGCKLDCFCKLVFFPCFLCCSWLFFKLDLISSLLSLLTWLLPDIP